MNKQKPRTAVSVMSELVGVLLAACVFTAAPTLASPARDATYYLDIPAQSLNDALQALALASQHKLLYSSELVDGKSSPALRGEFTTEQAVRRLLAGTNLTYEVTADGLVLIRQQGVESAQIVPTKSSGDIGLIRLAQQEGNSASAAAQRTEEKSTSAGTQPENTRAIPEILVEGSRLLNMDIRRTEDDPRPYVVFEREQIIRTGAANLEEFFKQRLPQNSTGLSSNQSNAIAGSGSSINLRGLGTGQTLILIDGHRIANRYSSGALGQPNLNAIPMSAIERIEILPGTASAIYGGGATGGVVNVILRRDYHGSEVKLAYENTFDSDTALRRIDFSSGFPLESGKTQVLFAGSYSEQNALSLGDRDFYQRRVARIAASNPNSPTLFGNTPPPGTTANISSTDGSPLFGPGTASKTFVPVGYAGGGGLAPLAANAGRYNLEMPRSGFPGTATGLLSAPLAQSLMLTVRRDFTPRVQAFVEGASFDNGSLYVQSFPTTNFTLSATAPNNPFGKAVNVRVSPTDLADGFVDAKIADRRAVAGVIVKLPAQWLAAADYTWSRSDVYSKDPPLMSAAATTAMSTGALDVLRDLERYPLDFSQYMVPGAANLTPFRSVLKNVTLRASGSVGMLPGGAPTLSALIERRDEDFDEAIRRQTATLTNLYPSRSQSVESAYMELRVPVISARNKLPGVQDLELQVAVRRDDYTVNASTASIDLAFPNTPILRSTSKLSATHPTFALRYQPIQDIALRGSYSTGFLPPTVNQVLPGAVTPPVVLTDVDPRRGGSGVGAVSRVTGGNPSLRPEESESLSFGLVFTPRWVEGLRLSIDYVKLDKTDNIVTLATQQIVDNESLFPERVTRGAKLSTDPADWAGPITQIDATLANVSKSRTEAIDAQLDWHIPTASYGAFDLYLIATHQMHYETQLVPTTPVVDNVGYYLNNPLAWKGSAALTWTLNRLSLGWNAMYLDRYRAFLPTDAPSTRALRVTDQGSEWVPSQIFHDVYGTYRFGASTNGTVGKLLSDVELQAGVKNVFNTRPAVNTLFLYGYNGFADPRMATYYFTLKKNF